MDTWLIESGRGRTGIAAGSPVPIDLMNKLITNLHLADITNAYGMSQSILYTTRTPFC
jgi:hypothetical protein